MFSRVVFLSYQAFAVYASSCFDKLQFFFRKEHNPRRLLRLFKYYYADTHFNSFTCMHFNRGEYFICYSLIRHDNTYSALFISANRLSSPKQNLIFQARRAKQGYKDSFTFATFRNVYSGQEITVCANYLQYRINYLPELKENAVSVYDLFEYTLLKDYYPLSWWRDKPGNTKVCPISKDFRQVKSSISAS